MTLDMIDRLARLKSVALECELCGLCKTRTNVVFSRGNPNAMIMIVGEAPGADEDQSGLAFVGRSGKLLDQYLERVGLDPLRDVFITNAVQCRPPNNRLPLFEELEACWPYLDQKIKAVNPSILVALGATAIGSLVSHEAPFSVGGLQGQWHAYKHNRLIKVMPMYHPSYLLRQRSHDRYSPRWHTWQAWRKVKEAIS